MQPITITREDFTRSEWSNLELRLASTWRSAAALATVGKSRKAVRLVMRRNMRDHALSAVREARANARARLRNAALAA